MPLFSLTKKWLHQTEDWFAPKACAGCQTYGPNPCQHCLDEIPVIASGGCQRCHHPSMHPDTLDCAWCRRLKIFPHHLASLFAYRGTAQKLLQQAKFDQVHQHYQTLLNPLPDAVNQVLPFADYDAIVPIPATFARRISRLANSADQIADQLQHITQVPINHGLKCRHLTHRRQVGLTHDERRRNVKNRFTWRSKQTVPKAAILVDDVLTTGATLEAATRVLKQAGVEQIAWFTLMRTL